MDQNKKNILECLQSNLFPLEAALRNKYGKRCSMSLDHVQNKHKLMIQGDASQFYGGRSESSQKVNKQNFGSKSEDKKNKSVNASVMSNRSGSSFGNYSFH